ncbi:NAD(P)/FAD-dependent oxidoreductase [Nocardioides humi]|uniref:FAD-dependent oxidoreductase n=1 Tax=Nocardioides humi TaxID=449461 RepID=A0ABN2B4Q2_9ACTN|nr:FAD/NAD(P)-binding oxidoreductase [Nocardioides humi]
MKNVIVVGGSIAGLSAVRALRAKGFDGQITVLDRDPVAPYRKPELSKGILSGRIRPEDIAIEWPADLGAERWHGAATAVDLHRRRLGVEVDRASLQLPFDGLVIASGSEARRHPTYAADAGVHVVRTLADATALADEVALAAAVVVVGGGFLGLEAAASVRHQGKPVTVVEAGPALLGARHGAAMSGAVADLHRAHGVDVRLAETVDDIELVGGRVAAVRLSRSGTIEADLVIWSTGATLDLGWLNGIPAATRDGVLCRPDCSVFGLEGVVAAGDVARLYNQRFNVSMRVEHWTNAIEQGTAAAATLLGRGTPLVSVPYVWSHQFDHKLEMIGCPGVAETSGVVRPDGGGLIVEFRRRSELVGASSLAAGKSLLAPYRAQLMRHGTSRSLQPDPADRR